MVLSLYTQEHALPVRTICNVIAAAMAMGNEVQKLRDTIAEKERLLVETKRTLSTDGRASVGAKDSFWDEIRDANAERASKVQSRCHCRWWVVLDFGGLELRPSLTLTYTTGNVRGKVSTSRTSFRRGAIEQHRSPRSNQRLHKHSGVSKGRTAWEGEGACWPRR